MPDHKFRLVLSPRGEPNRIEPDLEEKEMAAIGFVTAQWSYLEHVILDNTLSLIPDGEQRPSDANNLSFSKRLNAWRLTIERYAQGSDKSRLLRLVSKAANLEAQRHKIAHGLWTWDSLNPTRLTAFSFRPRVAFEATFDFDALIRLSLQIGELNFELTYPRGVEDALEAIADAASERPLVSRSFLLSVTEEPAKHRRIKRPKAPS